MVRSLVHLLDSAMDYVKVSTRPPRNEHTQLILHHTLFRPLRARGGAGEEDDEDGMVDVPMRRFLRGGVVG